MLDLIPSQQDLLQRLVSRHGDLCRYMAGKVVKAGFDSLYLTTYHLVYVLGSSYRSWTHRSLQLPSTQLV
jgi:hypothetical protein